MTLQHINRELARNKARDGRYTRVRRLLFHHLVGYDGDFSVFRVSWIRLKLEEGICVQAGCQQAGSYVLTGHPCAVAMWDVLAMHHRRPETPRVRRRRGKMMSETVGSYFVIKVPPCVHEKFVCA
jgi:hypothetical protein